MDDKELFSVVPYKPAEAEKRAFENYSYWGSVWYNFKKKKVAFAMMIMFLILLGMAIVVPMISGFSPKDMNPVTGSEFISPCSAHLFGTDQLGRDYWVIVWYSCRMSILLAFTVALGEMVVGVIFGLIWGYVPKTEGLFNALYNIVDNIPTIIILTLVTMFVGQNFWVMAISLIALGWLAMAISIRNMVLMYRDREFNLASRCLGTPLRRILSKNILPHLVSVIMLRLALSVPSTIAMEATLSYLGLGLDINTPTLGVLLKDAKSYFLDYPHMLIFPAIVVALITVAFYLAGNGFADATDPKNHR